MITAILPWFFFAAAHAVEPMPSATVHVTASSDPTELQRIRAEFQYAIGHDGYVSQCHNLISYREDGPGHDSSYGAVCTIAAGGVRKDWMLCNDWMVGKFTKSDHFEDTESFLVKFIQDHCPPGG